MKEEKRKPVSALVDIHGNIRVLCDDGSMWIYHLQQDRWRENAPVPGTRRDGEG